MSISSEQHEQQVQVQDDGWTLTWWMILPCTLLWYYYYCSASKQKKKNNNDNNQYLEIPWAPGAIPILGHAILYKKDPAGFLRRSQYRTGNNNGIFQLNLAGREMIMISSPQHQKRVAMAPESIMSARHAIADIGFEQTLGYANVHVGTDIHKRIIKGAWTASSSSTTTTTNKSNIHPTQQVQDWMEALQQSMVAETTTTTSNNNNPNKEYDWFHFMRRVVLRTVIDQMISPVFLTLYGNFLDEFMMFQDTLEDVTAKAVLLPKRISMPLWLLPLKRRRERLQTEIALHLKQLLLRKDDDDDDDDNKHNNNNNVPFGFWLQALVNENDNDDQSKQHQYSTEEIAELMVGLLFAAHKNPAIAAAQAFVFYKEQQQQQEDDDKNSTCCASMMQEAQNLVAHPNGETLASCRTMRHFCLEVLRLTAHSIGAVRTAQQDFLLPLTTEENNNNKTNNKTNTGATSYYLIPKGSTIGLVHIASHLNPNLWGPHPQDLDTSRPASAYQNEYHFTTFSHGVHKCPGQSLATLLVQCILALLIRPDSEWDIQPLLKSTTTTSKSKSTTSKHHDQKGLNVPPLCFERATLAQRKGPIPVSITYTPKSSPHQ